MNGNNSRLRANAPEWMPPARNVAAVNKARNNLIKKLTKFFGTRKNKVLIPRSENPVYNYPSENAYNRAESKLNLNMNYNTIQRNLKEENLVRRWNEPAENITTPITSIVRNISKNAYANINAANWEGISKNIRAEVAKGRRASRRASRRANRR